MMCCVACFERIVKYLTETAYIQVGKYTSNPPLLAIYNYIRHSRA